MRRRRKKGSDIKLMKFENVIDGNIKMKTEKNKIGALKGFFHEDKFDTLDIVDDAAYKNSNRIKGNWREIFGNENPIYLEVGTGRGKFITTMAKNNPNINFIGLELKEEVLVKAAEKSCCSENETLGNIRFIWGSVEYLDFYFEDGEIDRLYINFCDPWPKNKNAKRRLTSSDFLKLYNRKLKSPEVFFKTDNIDLFEYSLNEFSDCGWRLRNISLDLAHSSFEGNVTTEYEDKFVELGMPIYRLEAFKE